MDMLIKLYHLPSVEGCLVHLAREGVEVRRAMSYESSQVTRWVQHQFGVGWSDECAAAFGSTPVDCYIAVHARTVCGFCCLNTTFRNFIGPIGVTAPLRRKGVGRGLLLSALHALHSGGYAYAVVGDVGQPDFFRFAAGAIEIPDSTPGPYPVRAGV